MKWNRGLIYRTIADKTLSLYTTAEKSDRIAKFMERGHDAECSPNVYSCDEVPLFVKKAFDEAHKINDLINQIMEKDSEHVVSSFIGRPLLPCEYILFKDNDRENCDLENLYLAWDLTVPDPNTKDEWDSPTEWGLMHAECLLLMDRAGFKQRPAKVIWAKGYPENTGGYGYACKLLEDHDWSNIIGRAEDNVLMELHTEGYRSADVENARLSRSTYLMKYMELHKKLRKCDFKID